MFSDLNNEIRYVEAHLKRFLVIQDVEKDEQISADDVGNDLLEYIKNLEAKLLCSVCGQISEAPFYICKGCADGFGDVDVKEDNVVCGRCWKYTNSLTDVYDEIPILCPRCHGYADAIFDKGRESLLDDWKQSVKKY